MASRLGGIKQKKLIIHPLISMWFHLVCSPEPQSQIWIIIYQKWPITLNKQTRKNEKATTLARHELYPLPLLCREVSRSFREVSWSFVRGEDRTNGSEVSFQTTHYNKITMALAQTGNLPTDQWLSSLCSAPEAGGQIFPPHLLPPWCTCKASREGNRSPRAAGFGMPRE